MLFEEKPFLFEYRIYPSLMGEDVLYFFSGTILFSALLSFFCSCGNSGAVRVFSTITAAASLLMWVVLILAASGENIRMDVSELFTVYGFGFWGGLIFSTLAGGNAAKAKREFDDMIGEERVRELKKKEKYRKQQVPKLEMKRTTCPKCGTQQSADRYVCWECGEFLEKK